MKIMLLTAAAMAVGTVAQAQTGKKPGDPPVSYTVPHPDQAQGPRGLTQQGTVPSGAPCTPKPFQLVPGGYPRCEETAPPRQPCSKQVTDHCYQVERPVRP